MRKLLDMSTVMHKCKSQLNIRREKDKEREREILWLE